MLLYFYIRPISNPIILTSACRLVFSYSIEGQYTRISKKRTKSTRNRTCLKHSTAPPHHSCRRTNLIANRIKIPVSILSLFYNSLWIVFSITFNIIISRRKLQSSITKYVDYFRIGQRTRYHISNNSRIFPPRKGNYCFIVGEIFYLLTNKIERLFFYSR